MAGGWLWQEAVEGGGGSSQHSPLNNHVIATGQCVGFKVRGESLAIFFFHFLFS